MYLAINPGGITTPAGRLQGDPITLREAIFLVDLIAVTPFHSNTVVVTGVS